MGERKILDKSNSTPHPRPETRYNVPLTAKNMEELFSDCCDLNSRIIHLGGNERNSATLFYIDGLTGSDAISQNVIRPLTLDVHFQKEMAEAEIMAMIEAGAVYNSSVNLRSSMDDAANDLVSGFCALVFDGEEKAVTFEVKSGDKRGISPPEIEKAIRGAKDSFIEIIRTNSALVRRKLRNPDLKIRDCLAGRQSQTSVNILYIDGLTDMAMVDEVEKRLNELDIDGVLAPQNIEAYIADNRTSLFPQLLYTERPDRFCINLLEGRVGVLIDGLPLGYLVPGTFAQFMKVPEDNANHFAVASYLTALRYICLVIALFLPAFYVAVAMHHHEMLPTKLMLSIIESKQNVPFSTFMEVLGMLVAFEVLMEAGLRLPNPIGAAVSIIGGLIVGQAAVEANLVSPVVVIIVAVAGITSYTLPSHDLASVVRLLRILLVILGALTGMFGLILGAVLIVYHLASIESFGVPYLTPFAGTDGKGIWRAVFRLPLYKSKRREELLNPKNKRNQK